MANQNGKQKAYEPGTLALFAGLGILMSILGVVSLLAVVGGVQGMAFEKIKQVMQGLGGSLCIGLSVLLIWGGALCMFTAGKNVPKRSYFAMLVLFLCVLGIFNLLSSVGTQNLMDYGVQYNQTQYDPPLSQVDGYWNLIRFGYRISSGSGVFGGALGMLLAWPAWMFLGKAFGVTVLGVVCIACVLLMTHFDFLQMVETIKEKNSERKKTREAQLAQQQYEQQQWQAQQQAAEEQNSLNYPAFLRRRKPQKAERLDDQPPEQQPQAAYQQPQMAAPQTVPPGYTLMYAPNGQPYYAPVNPQPWQQAPQPQPQQPEMYNEIVMPADAEPLWRKGRKKDKTPPNRSPFSGPPSYPSAQPAVVQPEPVQEPEGDAIILSASKRRALERLEQIRKRKAEIDAELAGNEAARQSRETPPWEENPAPFMETNETNATNETSAAPARQEEPAAAERAPQTFAPAATFAPANAPQSFAPAAAAAAAPVLPPSPAPEPVDRDAAYKRPTPIAQQTGPVTRSAPVKEIHDEPRRQTPYVYPSIELLNLQQREIKDTRAQDIENAGRLEKTLESFNIPAKVERVTHGPAVTRFELGFVSNGVNVKRITNIADNIALDLAANGGVRIEVPIPGTNLFGIEVPNREIQSVSLAEVLLSPEMKSAKSPLTVALGRDIAGKPVLCDLAKMPHLLIAGQTGSGKSVCINAIINSLLYRTSPEDVRMIMIDPKVVELQCYNVIPHLLIPVVSDPHKAAGALSWAVAEMLERYHKMQTKNVREISAYNAKLEPGEEKLPRIVIIIDELADLMLACKKDVEESIIRLAQLARAAGIHMVVATQRPTVDVITGLIKANIPSRIAFAVSSSIDSRTILDQNGAEKLLGKGDMFYFPTGASAPLRVQGCFLSDAETERVVTFIGEHSKVEFDEDVLESLENSDDTTNPLDEGGGDDSGVDDRLAEAIEMVIADGQASISMLQRRMKIGYARAGRLIDDMANRGIVSKSVGSKPREVLITREEFEKIKETLH